MIDKQTKQFSFHFFVYVNVILSRFYLLMECTKISKFSRIFKIHVMYILWHEEECYSWSNIDLRLNINEILPSYDMSRRDFSDY
jgi:hypothetical protein